MCIKGFVEHRLNPLHIYCRVKNILLGIGIGTCNSTRIAKGVCKWYEHKVFRTVITNLLHINMKGR